MARRVIYLVYVLPVVLSLFFGSIVMLDVLQEPGRELNLLRVVSFEENQHDEPIEIIGLKNQYSNLEPVQIQIIVEDLSFSCGDLYVTIYTSEEENAVTQSGYFEQCFDDNNRFLPIREKFSEIVEIPGKYKLVADMLDKTQKNSITTSEEFTVK